MEPTRSRARRWPTLMVLAAFAVVTTSVAPPSQAQATPLAASQTSPNCDSGGGNLSPYWRSLQAADRNAAYGPKVMEDALRSTGSLYLCGLNAFYDTDGLNMSGYSPGDVIRAAPLYPSPGGPKTVAMRVMYASTLRDGTLAATTGLVMLPRKPVPTGGRTSYVWTHGTIGLDDGCTEALDYMWTQNPIRRTTLDPVWNRDGALLAPDYFGIGAPTPGREFHSYMVKVEQATATLDLIRAAQELQGATGVNDKAIVFGHSQGGHTALSVNEVQQDYAPDVDLLGTSAISPPGELEVLVDLADQRRGTSNEFFLGLATLAWADTYTELGLDAREIISDEGDVYSYGVPYMSTPYDILYHFAKNDQTAADLAQKLALYNTTPEAQILGVLMVRTPDGAFYQNAWNTADGKTWWNGYSMGNLTFASPRKNKLIVGCVFDYNAAAVGHAQHGPNSTGTMMTDEWLESDTLLTMQGPSGPLDANSAPRASSDVPLLFQMGNCDELFPLTVPTVKPCNANATTNPVGGDFVLQPGHSWGPAAITLGNICLNTTTPSRYRVYGESDINGDGVIEAGMADGVEDDDPTKWKRYGHSSILSAGAQLNDPVGDESGAFNDLYAFWDSVSAGTFTPDCTLPVTP